MVQKSNAYILNGPLIQIRRQESFWPELPGLFGLQMSFNGVAIVVALFMAALILGKSIEYIKSISNKKAER